jgi:hypothetical protein
MADTAPKTPASKPDSLKTKAELDAEAARETEQTQAATSKRSKTGDGDVRWGESSDPEVHKILAEIGALEQNRRALDPPENDEAIAVLDAEIEAAYHRLNHLNDPESVKLREQRQKAAAKGDVKEVAAIDAKLSGTKDNTDK